MKISVDVGALCSKNHFGNYILTQNFIEAINLYDPSNEYYLYSFCNKPEWLRLNKNIHYRKILPQQFWMKGRVSLEEITNKKDIFLALNQAIPLFTSSRIISFCHGLSYYFYPQYYPDSSRKLKQQLKRMIDKSSYIIVSSQKVREELTTVFPNSEMKTKVLPFGIPFDMLTRSRNKFGMTARENYFLYVGMDHPIKNISFIKNAFKIFKSDKKYKDYKLICVTGGMSREKLNELYQKAVVLLTASYYESFNLPVLEALSQGCPVVGLQSAIVPELSPYVYTAQNFDEFIEQMKRVVKGQAKKIDKKRLSEQFYWKKYVKKLTQFYD